MLCMICDGIHKFILQEEPVFHGISKKGISNENFDRLMREYNTCFENGTIDKIVDASAF